MDGTILYIILGAILFGSIGSIIWAMRENRKETDGSDIPIVPPGDDFFPPSYHD